MTVVLLSNRTATVRPISVLASLNDNFPYHLVICDERESVAGANSNMRFSAIHMGPPVRTNRIRYDAVCSIELADNEAQKIRFFMTERLQEAKELEIAANRMGKRFDRRTQYRIHPAATRPSRDCSYWRFSCVGFVLTAYHYGRIELLSANCPPRELSQIKKFYSAYAADLNDPSARAAMGLDGDGPWPIALVGYVLHSFARSDAKIHGPQATPYSPQLGDEYFPAKRSHRSRFVFPRSKK